MGSIGNEAADKLAKEAAKFGSSKNHLLPNYLRKKLPASMSAIKQNIEQVTKTETKLWWKQSTCYKCIRRIDPSLPSVKFLLTTSKLT
jgi:hypothetical protein